jgi:hypothetical protein
MGAMRDWIDDVRRMAGRYVSDALAAFLVIPAAAEDKLRGRTARQDFHPGGFNLLFSFPKRRAAVARRLS